MTDNLDPRQHLRLPRRPRAELEAVVLARQLMQQAGMTDSAAAEVEAAVIETVINAFEHGDVDEVNLQFEVTPSAFTVRVDDAGAGFDAGAVDRADPAEKRRRGETRGWGLEIVRRSMDDVHVESGPNGTSITMIKHR